jgi:pyruvate ferredoxin oxidoreductase gamma subunit/2-oxoisovalerate ferredoxin oxidoreductase gamma subunit
MGAFAKMLGMPPMESVAMAIEDEIPEHFERNILAAKDAYDAVDLRGFIGEDSSERAAAAASKPEADGTHVVEQG